ncbi:MAG TPA: hypothetical protein VFU15_10625 [Bacteroidia bacterium]|nr:hypothetical protein [Bacteroidia bacterium]
MKTIPLTLFFLSFVLLLGAQTPKYALLDAKDPVVGTWEWIGNDTGSMAAPVPDLNWQFIQLAAGSDQSMGALSYSDEKGYECASYFLAFSNGQMITGTLSQTCLEADKGKKFTMGYRYDAMNDQLVLTIRGETFYYRRKS